MKSLSNQIGILGPIGAMLGRDLEQEVMLLNYSDYLPEAIINRSVAAAPHSIKIRNICDHPVEYEEPPPEENQGQAKETTGRRPGRDTR